MKQLFMGLLALCSVGASAQSYSGRVFVDKNGNHRYDKGEKTLGGVSVSDGLNVVKTGNDGQYSLAGHADARFVFITMPSGYRGATYWQRIEAGQGEYDFELMPADPQSVAADGTHRFVHISDTHMYDSYLTALDGYAYSMKQLRQYVANEHIAFVIHTGDIAREGFGSYRDFLNNRNVPASQVYYAIGNHDLGTYKGEGKYGEDLFERHFGPAFYSFEVGNVHYIVTPMPGGDGKPTYTSESIGRWLKNDLKHTGKDKVIVGFNHSVMSGDGHFRFGSDKEGYIDLADHNLKAWIYGHWHNHRWYYHDDSDVLMICSPGQERGSYDRSPSSYRVLTADAKGNLSSEIRYTHIEPKVTVASVDNGLAPVDEKGRVMLSVNAYSSTSSAVSVKCRLLHHGKEVVKYVPLEQQTDFNWYKAFQVPPYLDGQTLTIEAKATFGNGETKHEQTSFEYACKEVAKVKLGEAWTNLLQNTAHVPLKSDTLRLPLQPAWVCNVGANIYYTSPLIYDGKVYIATQDDGHNGRASVACIDASCGKIVWRYALRNTVRSNIAITDHAVVAQDMNGWVYSIDTDSGDLLWEKDLKMHKQTALDNGVIAGKGMVYVGAGCTLGAYRARTGASVWQSEIKWDVCSQGTATAGNGVYYGQDGRFYACDMATGKPIWNGKGVSTGSPAALHGNLLYFTGGGKLHVVNAQTGEYVALRKYDMELRSLSTPLVTDSEIIFGTSEDGVMAVDKRTFDEKWKFRTGRGLIYTMPTIGDPGSPVEGSPVLNGRHVFVGANDGCLYALDRKTGDLKWKHETGAPMLASVAVSGNTLVAVDFSGNVYAFASGK